MSIAQSLVLGANFNDVFAVSRCKMSPQKVIFLRNSQRKFDDTVSAFHYELSTQGKMFNLPVNFVI